METYMATQTEAKRFIVSIYGLGCGGGGVLTIQRALEREVGVLNAYVNPATEMAYVEYNPELTTPQHLVSVVKRVGFQAGTPRIQ